MFSLYWLARWAGHNSDATLKKASKKCKDPAGMQRALTAPPSARLMQACRKNGPTCLTGEWESLFLALPERLLASLSYFIGDTKSGNGRPAELPVDIAARLDQLRTSPRDVRFERLRPECLTSIKRVVLCHGLSPVGDSILLLADLGRAHRVSTALALPIEIMLTAVEWQKANRSVKQLTSITTDDVLLGLTLCEARRVALYTKLGIACKPFSLDPAQLERMSTFYRALASELWQVNTSGSLSIEQQRTISHPLSDDLEKKHGEHLELLRFFAKQFNGFDHEFFAYFFNQYCSQTSYRGNSLKIAVESELKFDQPFEELTACLASWQSNAKEAIAGPDAGLMVAYLPQYQLGKLRILPYTPVSLDAMKLDDSIKQDHRQIQARIISLEEDQDETQISDLLNATPLLERNRLAADLTSFLIFCGRKLGIDNLRTAARKAGMSLEDMLLPISSKACALFEQEVSLGDAAAVRSFWSAGVEEALCEEHPQSLPLHLVFSLYEEQDWSTARLTALAKICSLCKLLSTEQSRNS